MYGKVTKVGQRVPIWPSLVSHVSIFLRGRHWHMTIHQTPDLLRFYQFFLSCPLSIPGSHPAPHLVVMSPHPPWS